MKLALFGYGGHAKEVSLQINKEITFFVDNQYSNEVANPISTFDPKEFSIMVAVSNSKDRAKIVERLPKETKYFTFIHPSSHIMDNNIIIGEGSFIGANSILTTNINLGKHTLLNRSNHIGHDCEIGDYFSMMPGAIVSGNVRIGNEVYMGTNSSIKEKVSISSSSILGMNSCTIKNINSPGTYVGVPSKKIK
tara:strand:- start:1413 stop:1991 length:579 start_codon:yes stop_codon:yes gene_type:complete